MKLDSLPKEKPIVAFKLVNGNGWLTTHRLIIEKEIWNPHYGIMEKQAPQIHILRNLKKTEIKGEILTVHFKDRKRTQIQLQEPHTPEQLRELKVFIEQAASKQYQKRELK
ncbi:MAG: hypothetical protein QXL10_01595 [Candidatus Bathyarchaeia archaeon]